MRVPNAALRFYPERVQVRPDDADLLENKAPRTDEAAAPSSAARSADEKAEVRRRRNRRHVWVVDGPFLRAVEIVTGLSNSNYTEVVSGDLHEGQKLVTGIQAKD